MPDEPQKVTLFSSQSGVGLSNWFQLAYDEDNPYESRIVSIRGRSDSWGSADVKIRVSHDAPDLDASPQAPADYLQVLSGTTMADLLLEANFNLALVLNFGVYLALEVVADDGSPLTVIEATAKGPIVQYTG